MESRRDSRSSRSGTAHCDWRWWSSSNCRLNDLNLATESTAPPPAQASPWHAENRERIEIQIGSSAPLLDRGPRDPAAAALAPHSAAPGGAAHLDRQALNDLHHGTRQSSQPGSSGSFPFYNGYRSNNRAMKPLTISWRRKEISQRSEMPRGPMKVNAMRGEQSPGENQSHINCRL